MRACSSLGSVGIGGSVKRSSRARSRRRSAFLSVRTISSYLRVMRHVMHVSDACVHVHVSVHAQTTACMRMVYGHGHYWTRT